MAHLVSRSQGFIYQDTQNAHRYIIDGAQATDEQKTVIEGAKIVQLRKARTEESGFDWKKHRVDEVEIKNVMIVDETDINCLLWIIGEKVKITFSSASLFVSPLASSKLADKLNDFDENTKVVPGSYITIPQEGGSSGYGRTEKITFACERVGFTTQYW